MKDNNVNSIDPFSYTFFFFADLLQPQDLRGILNFFDAI